MCVHDIILPPHPSPHPSGLKRDNDIGEELAATVNEDDPQDIFSRESQFIRRNSKSLVNNSSNSSLSNTLQRRKKKPENDSPPVEQKTPTHVRVMCVRIG